MLSIEKIGYIEFVLFLDIRPNAHMAALIGMDTFKMRMPTGKCCRKEGENL